MAFLDSLKGLRVNMIALEPATVLLVSLPDWVIICPLQTGEIS